MMKRFIGHAAAGLAIGWIMTTACLWIFGCGEDGVSGFTVLRNETAWLAASVFYGVISLIYDTNIPLPAAIALHLFGCGAVTFIGSFAAGFFEMFDPWPYWFIYVLPVFIVIYIIIGFSITITEKRRARKINEKIEATPHKEH